jgi:hypothetical protein
MSTELDVLKEIPGYKAILKSVLKSQIQMLVRFTIYSLSTRFNTFVLSDLDLHWLHLGPK